MKKRIGTLCLSLCLAAVSMYAQDNITVHDDETDQDEVIDLPEGMTSDIDSLLHEWNVKNYLSPDETASQATRIRSIAKRPISTDYHVCRMSLKCLTMRL